MNDALYDEHLREIPILLLCNRCRRYISNETGHGCDLTHAEKQARRVERRLKIDYERRRRAA